jgi:hypothetical protein
MTSFKGKLIIGSEEILGNFDGELIDVSFVTKGNKEESSIDWNHTKKLIYIN